ncbi:MAG: hypothetical protein FJX75_02810 [Armatimonadetes bacterium]|nr:hypothetical protein [Armatimonadota bacterium]
MVADRRVPLVLFIAVAAAVVPWSPASAGISASLKWRLELGTGWNACPAVADLDLDGYMELLVGSTDGHLYCLQPSGRVLWRVNLGGEVLSSPAIGDVDGDGALEVVVGSMDGAVYCLSPEAEVEWRFATGDSVPASPVIADVDLDGSKEIVIGSQDNSLYCLTGKGEERWRHETDSWVVGTAAVGDLTGDGAPEIVFGSMDYKVYALKGDGSVLWTYETAGWVQSSPAIADLDGEGCAEVLVVSDDNNLYCLNCEGRRKWNVGLGESEHQRASPVVADIQPGGPLEVVAASEGGSVGCYSAYGGRTYGGSTGGACVASPLVVDLGGDRPGLILTTTSGELVGLASYGGRLFTVKLGFQCWSTPLAVDLDRDGKLELYVGIRRDEERPEGYFYQYELTMPSSSAPWRCFHGDQARTGCFANALSYSNALAKGFDYGTAWEPFQTRFVPVVPQIKTTASMWVADRLDDTETGNGLLDGAERATLDVFFRNDSDGIFRDLLIAPKIEGKGVVMYPGSMYLGRVPPGATKRVRFTLGAPRDVPSHHAKLTFAAKESGVSVALATADVGVAPFLEPTLKIVKAKVDDSQTAFTTGNGNGVLGLGEEALLYLSVHNTANGTAKSLKARIEAIDRNVLVIVGAADLGDLRPAGTATGKFHLRIAENATGTQVRLRVVLGATGVPSFSKIAGFHLERVWHDNTPPLLTIARPAGRVVSVKSETITVRGYAVDASGVAKLTLNNATIVGGATYPIDGPSGKGFGFVFVRHLELGENPLTITAVDGAGNVATRYVRVIRK